MKKINFLIVAILFTTTSFAQSAQNEIELIQSVYGMEKKEIVTSFVELDEDQKTNFWILYDAYELKRKELGKNKFAVLLKYVDDFGEILPEDAELIMKKSIAMRKKSDKLIDNYYKKIKKKTDPVVALQFYQIERYLTGVIRTELLEELFTTKN